MKQIGIWRIEDDTPVRVKASEIELERHLEDWIERDPNLLEEGLRILGRQVSTRGGRLDLLAIDMQGRWTVIELKPSALYREALAQALDYAACVAEMDPDQLERTVNDYLRGVNPGGSVTASSALAEAGNLESLYGAPRDVQIVLVGTGRSGDLGRVTGFLERACDAPVKTVTYQVFEPESGTKILVRELRSGEGALAAEVSKSTAEQKLQEVRQHADAAGTRQLLEDFIQVGEELDLHRRPWGRSVMFAPQDNKTICLFTLWVDLYKDDTVKLWVVPTKIAQYFAVSEDDAVRLLGEDSGRKLTHTEARETLAKIRAVITGASGGP